MTFRAYITAACLLLITTTLTAGNRLRVAFVGDPQVDNATELEYARKSVYKELRALRNVDMFVFLGDMVNEAPGLMPPTRALLDSLPAPWFCVPGNHDDVPSFRKVFGQGDTSFVEKGVRFILMNNCEASPYGLSEGQQAVLDSLLDITPGRVVLCTHVPLRFCKDGALEKVASLTNVLLVSGHLHRVFRSRVQGGTADEIGTGAACGSWWRGEKDEYGVPYALMNCGAPRGWFLVDFDRKGDYRVDYKCVGRSAADRASVSAIGDSLFVNVYGGHTDAKLTLTVGKGVRKQQFQCLRSNSVAPEVRQVLAENASRSREWRRSHKEEFIPLRRLPSPHVWACALPEGVAENSRVCLVYSDGNMKFKQTIKVR